MTHDGYMQCSCKHFEVCGIGCSHIMNVLRTVQPMYYTKNLGYERCDVSVIWWRLYTTTPVESNLWIDLKALRDSDIIGPRCHDYQRVLSNIDYNTNNKLPDRFIIRKCTSRCKNYDESYITFRLSSSSTTFALTQTSSVILEDDEPVDNFDVQIDTKNAPLDDFQLTYGGTDDKDSNDTFSSDDNNHEYIVDKYGNENIDDVVKDNADPYAELKGYFISLTDNLRLLPNEERRTEIQRWKNTINDAVAGYKPISISEVSNNLVSTNAIYTTKQKQLLSKNCF